MDKNTILDDIWVKQLLWYGRLQGMDEERLPQKNLNRIPTGRRKIRRPKTIRHTHSYERMWSPRWRLGGQTSLEMGVLKDVAIRNRTTTCIQIHSRTHSGRVTMNIFFLIK
jgi:hypothetical protein